MTLPVECGGLGSLPASPSVPTEKTDGPAALIQRLEAENARLRTALEPFAAYSQEMDAYAAFHRGQSLPDSKVLAYGQTEMNTCAALVVGHFRDADAVFAGRARGWSGFYRSTLRARASNSASPGLDGEEG